MFKLDTFKRKINFFLNVPFMQIRELPRCGQLSIHGNVVNVPADVNSNKIQLSLSDVNEGWVTGIIINFRTLGQEKC